MLNNVMLHSFYNERLYDLIKDIRLPTGYKINFKDEHIFRDGFKVDAKMSKSKILSLNYNNQEIGLLHPSFNKYLNTKELGVSINFIQGIKSNQGKYPKEWFSKLLVPLVSSVYAINPELKIVYTESGISNVTDLKNKVLEAKHYYEVVKQLLNNSISEMHDLELIKFKSNSKNTKELDLKINKLRDFVYKQDYKIQKIQQNLIFLNAKLSFITSIRDRYFSKAGILDLKTSKKSRVLNAIKFSKKVLIANLKNKKKPLNLVKVSKVPKIKKQNVIMSRKKGPKF
jgi:hypothetical protein